MVDADGLPRCRALGIVIEQQFGAGDAVPRGESAMRVAAIDCGTNSIRLLIADIGADGAHELRRDMQVVRLGQGVDATGRFADEAIARTFAACDEYAAICREFAVERIRFVATSATRDAANRDVFMAGVQQRLGVLPDVISGDEEATLSFAGATRELLGSQPTPFLVVDIGGGTSDFTVIRLNPQRSAQSDRKADILATTGVHLGGTDFDRLLDLATVMPLLGYRHVGTGNRHRICIRTVFESKGVHTELVDVLFGTGRSLRADRNIGWVKARLEQTGQDGSAH